MIADGEVQLFVRCGRRFEPPGWCGSWEVVTLPAELGSAELPSCVSAVRSALRPYRRARVLVAGPVALGVALGQALAHEPVAIDYLQLNQLTKEIETWLSNRQNL